MVRCLPRCLASAELQAAQQDRAPVSLQLGVSHGTDFEPLSVTSVCPRLGSTAGSRAAAGRESTESFDIGLRVAGGAPSAVGSIARLGVAKPGSVLVAPPLQCLWCCPGSAAV